VIYRPPASTANGLTYAEFFKEWSVYLDNLSASQVEPVIVGDMNFHLDNLDNTYTVQFNSFMDTHGLKQYVTGATHRKGHTLDVVITRDQCGDFLCEFPYVFDPGLCDNKGNLAGDHLAISFKVNVGKPPSVRKDVAFRRFKDINLDAFNQDLINSAVLFDIDKPLTELIDTYDSVLKCALDRHAPEVRKIITIRPNTSWYTQELRDAKHAKRKLERTWRRTRLTVHHELYREQCKLVNRLLHKAKQDFYSDKIVSCGRDQKQLSRITKNLMGDSGEVTLPSYDSKADLAESFIEFFSSKIANIRSSITSDTDRQPPEDLCANETLFTGQPLTDFAPVSTDEVRKILMKAPAKSCELDVVPTWLLKHCIEPLLPCITAIINKSLAESDVPASYKRAIIRPLIKKPGLERDILKNYRPVSNLNFLSKVLERVVSARLEEHLTMNKLHDRHQSAYRQNHSTETALLKVQTDILDALDGGSSVILIMTDLSAAFDTLDHAILMQRLSHSFGIRGPALDWIQSYLTNRTQCVAILDTLSKDSEVKFGVPQGSVLGPRCTVCIRDQWVTLRDITICSITHMPTIHRRILS
jgi:hypothetical protein